jgi:Flp pilus assembly protein protease CpaA
MPSVNDAGLLTRRVPARFQSLASGDFAGDGTDHEVLHGVVVLGDAHPYPLDQRAWKLRCQWLDRFVAFDARSWHGRRIDEHRRRGNTRRVLNRGRCYVSYQGISCIPKHPLTDRGRVIRYERTEVVMLNSSTPYGHGVLVRFLGGPSIPSLCAVSAAVLLSVVYFGTPQFWLMPIVAIVAVAAAVVDWRERRVPNRVTGAGMLVTIAVALPLVITREIAVSAMVLGAVIMSAPLFVSHLVTRSRTPGLGDVKLAAVLGASAGAVHPVVAYAALLVALVLGAMFGLFYRHSTNERTFPLAPAISTATVLVLAIAAQRVNGGWSM